MSDFKFDSIKIGFVFWNSAVLRITDWYYGYHYNESSFLIDKVPSMRHRRRLDLEQKI